MRYILWIGFLILLTKLKSISLTTSNYLFLLKRSNKTKESFIDKDKLKIPYYDLKHNFYEVIYRKKVEGYETPHNFSISENSRYSAICSQNLTHLKILELKFTQNNISLINNKFAIYKRGMETCHLFNIEDSILVPFRNKIWGELIRTQNNSAQIIGFTLSEAGTSYLRIKMFIDSQQDTIVLKYNSDDAYNFYFENNSEIGFSQNNTSSNYHDLTVEIQTFNRSYQKSGYHNFFETSFSLVTSKNIE